MSIAQLHAEPIGAPDSLTDLPAEWLQVCWNFPQGEIPGVTGTLNQSLRFDWTGIQPSLAAELKWAIATRCLTGRWRAQFLVAIRAVVKDLMAFLRDEAPEARSLLERSSDTWLLEFRSHLIARGGVPDQDNGRLRQVRSRWRPGVRQR